jgi:hypothetical protein
VDARGELAASAESLDAVRGLGRQAALAGHAGGAQCVSGLRRWRAGFWAEGCSRSRVCAACGVVLFPAGGGLCPNCREELAPEAGARCLGCGELLSAPSLEGGLCARCLETPRPGAGRCATGATGGGSRS